MIWVLRKFSIYGPDAALFGLIAALALVIDSALDGATRVVADSAFVAAFLARVTAQIHSAVAAGAKWLFGQVIGPLLKHSLFKIVVVVGAVAGIGYGVSELSSYAAIAAIAALAVAATGLVGQVLWFWWRRAGWNAANA